MLGMSLAHHTGSTAPALPRSAGSLQVVALGRINYRAGRVSVVMRYVNPDVASFVGTFSKLFPGGTFPRRASSPLIKLCSREAKSAACTMARDLVVDSNMNLGKEIGTTCIIAHSDDYALSSFSLMELTKTVMPLVDAPEVLLPSQLPTRGREAGAKIAEYRLLIAVLEDAVHCFQQFLRPKNQKERLLFADAEAWIMDRGQAAGHRANSHPHFFSFEYVCEALSLDPESVREQLRRWRRWQQDSTHSGLV
jgi:hypothetical protein